MPNPPDIFGIDLQGIVGDALGSSVFDFTLTVRSPGTRTSDLTAGTQPTETAHSVKGFVDTYDDRLVDGTRIQTQDRKIVLLGASLPSGVVPQEDDKITAEGRDWTIVRVKRDPAGATYECQSR